MRTLKLDDLYAMPKLREGKLIPGTEDVVYLTSVSKDDIDYVSIVTMHVPTKETTVIATNLISCSGLRVSPDGTRLSYMGTIDGAAQIIVMDLDTASAPQPLLVIERGISSPPVWSPDGQWLAFTAIGEERVAKGPYDPIQSSNVHLKYDGGVGLLERRAQDIYIVGADGGNLKRLTHGPGLMTSPSWMPDSGSVVFTATLGPDSIEFVTKVGRVSLDGEITWPVAGVEDYLFGAPVAAGTGDAVLLPCKPPSMPLGAQARLYRVALDGDGALEARTERLTKEQGGHVSRGTLLPNGVGSLFLRAPISPVGSDKAFAIVEREGHNVVHRIALDGDERCEPLTPADKSAYLQDATDTKILYAQTDMNRPPELWVANTDGSDAEQLTRLSEPFVARYDLPDIVEVRCKAEDGTPLHGWFYKPAGSRGPVPTVVEIHGGPHAAWGNAFNLWAHALAGAGIGVLLPNPRGSSGYGDAFGTAIHGCWGEPDSADLLRMADEVVDRGLADPDRLGVGGVSGGGHLTTWLLGHTDRFKAAIPEQMLTNMISFYGQSDVGRLLVKGEFGVTPQTDHGLLWRYSPLAYAHNATTPTLLIQCELDVRCPMGEAEQFFRALCDAGCEAVFLRIPNSYHAGPQYYGITELARARDEPALEWYRKYLT